jgi:hypothetical protein
MQRLRLALIGQKPDETGMNGKRHAALQHF